MKAYILCYTKHLHWGTRNSSLLVVVRLLVFVHLSLGSRPREVEFLECVRWPAP